MRSCLIELDQRLEVKVEAHGEGGAKTMRFRLTPVLAQKLADCLLEYAGVVTRSYARRSREVFPAVYYDDTPAVKRHTPVVRVGKRR